MFVFSALSIFTYSENDPFYGSLTSNNKTENIFGSLDDVLEVVNSKEYKHNLKVAILKAAKEFKLGDHHIPHALLRVAHQTAGTSDIAFEFSFEVTEEEADSTPELVDSLKRLIMSFTDAEVLKDLNK